MLKYFYPLSVHITNEFFYWSSTSREALTFSALLSFILYQKFFFQSAVTIKQNVLGKKI